MSGALASSPGHRLNYQQNLSSPIFSLKCHFRHQILETEKYRIGTPGAFHPRTGTLLALLQVCVNDTRGPPIPQGILVHIHLMDSSRLPSNKDETCFFSGNEPCMPRTAILTFKHAYGYANCTGWRFNFTKNTAFITSFLECTGLGIHSSNSPRLSRDSFGYVPEFSNSH